MLTWILTPFRFIPIGWCRPDTKNRFWRNRRGGSMVFVGDVFENLTDAANPLVFRSPKGSWVVRDQHGNITGTITPPFRDDHRP